MFPQFAKTVTACVRRLRTLKSSPLLWGTGFVFSASILFRARVIHLDAEAPSNQDEFLGGKLRSWLIDIHPLTRTNLPVDPATSITFPTTIRIPITNAPPKLSLIGVGVRRVSFLGVKVYSVGFYADLSDPNLNISKDATSDEKIQHIVQNAACLIRIVPTRSTSYGHMRDGFMRALQTRARLTAERGTLSPKDEANIQSPLQKFKSIFPSTPLPKGAPLDIYLSSPTPGKPRAFIVRDLGSVENDWVGQEFMLAYFEGQGISPPLKASAVERLSNFGK